MTDDVQNLLDRDNVALMLAIADARSFSGAGVRLGMSQPAVSQKVQRLEKAAGRILFRRTSTGVELTSDGEAVVIYARAMAGLADDLRRHFRDSATPVKLSIGLAEDFCRTALPTVLWLFLRDHPRIEMRIVSGTIEALMDAVRARSVDLAVTRRHPAYPDVTSLWTDKVTWVGRPDLPMPIADPVPLVLPAAPSPVRDALMETLRRHGRAWRVPFEAFSLAGIESALTAGIGICAAPCRMQLVGVARYDARCGLPEPPDAEFVMSVPDHRVSGAVAAFAQVLQQAAISSFAPPEALAL